MTVTYICPGLRDAGHRTGRRVSHRDSPWGAALTRASHVDLLLLRIILWLLWHLLDKPPLVIRDEKLDD